MRCPEAIRFVEEACQAKQPILLAFKHPWQRKTSTMSPGGQRGRLAFMYYNSITNHEVGRVSTCTHAHELRTLICIPHLLLDSQEADPLHALDSQEADTQTRSGARSVS